MSEHDLEQLLGGFATDTLTPEEKQALYIAALQDQQLFNALADDQELKELLADPVVRRRLLQDLQQTSASGGSLSWRDWFRRPARLAFAGGLAVAVFAVVLGAKIYQDSLKQAAQSGATEESKQPAPPPIDEPQLKDKKNAAPASEPPKKDALVDKMAKGEKSAVSALSKSAEEVASSADQKLAASSAPSAVAPAPMEAPPGPASTGAVPMVSPRALFYSGAFARPDTGRIAAEKERAVQPLGESDAPARKSERKFDQFSQLNRAKGTMTTAKPLGLRYSFVIRGADGQDREVDAPTASKSSGAIRLTVEANQDAYLQIWKTGGASTAQLLLPQQDTGQISIRIAESQRQSIPLPTASELGALTVRLSRVPFGPITRQEAAMLDRFSPHQLQESNRPGEPSASQEQATYVVNRDLSPTAQLSVEIPLSLH